MATASKTKTSVTPLDDRVLVRPTEQASQTASGIYLPESAKEKPMTGTIVAQGPGKLTDDGDRAAMTVSLGDTVLFGKYAGTEVEVDGEELMIMRESDLLGIVG